MASPVPTDIAAQLSRRKKSTTKRRDDQRVLRQGAGPHRAKTGFVRILVIGGSKRDERAPNVPTIWEVMEKHKTPDAGKRLTTVLLSPGDFGLPIVGGPGIPADRVKILREGFLKAMKDPELLAEAAKAPLGTRSRKRRETSGAGARGDEPAARGHHPHECGAGELVGRLI